MSKKKVIITGSTGFIGANLTRRLLHDGHEIHLLVRPDYNPWRIKEIKRQVTLHVVDLADAPRLTKVVKKINPRWIFHLASHGAYAQQTDVQQMVQSNILSTVNLLQAALETEFEALVNTGSSSEYGFKNYAPKESDALEPNSHYAVTKAAATWFCRYTAQSQQRYIPTLRPYSVYGPYEEPSRLMPTLLMYASREIWPPLVSPTIARDFIYTEDVCSAFIAATNHKSKEWGPVYNLGMGRQISMKKLVALVRSMFKVKAKPKFDSMPNRKWDTSIWQADVRKIKRELKWKPKYSLKDGLVEMRRWWKDNPDWYRYYQDYYQLS